MPAYMRSCLALAAVAATLAGCGSDSGGFQSNDGGAGFDSTGSVLDGNSSPGVESGSNPAVGYDAGATLGYDASSTSGSDSSSSVSPGTDSGSGSDAGSGSASDAGSDAGVHAGADSGSETKHDAASPLDASNTPDAAPATDGGNASVCNFASGLNIAWVNFANDVPNPDIATFTTIFQNTYAAGGRVIRWWLHTNGTVTPGYQTSGPMSGMAQDLPASHTAGVKAILAAAHAAGVAVDISLWSFDMLQGSESISATTMANNIAFLQNDTNRQAYITNYLTPLVTALKGTPGLYSYEIFNEPEGMGPSGWTTGARTTEAYIQRTVNWRRFARIGTTQSCGLLR